MDPRLAVVSGAAADGRRVGSDGLNESQGHLILSLTQHNPASSVACRGEARGDAQTSEAPPSGRRCRAVSPVPGGAWVAGLKTSSACRDDPLVPGSSQAPVPQPWQAYSAEFFPEEDRTHPCTPTLSHTAQESLPTLATLLFSLQDRGAAEPSFLFQVTSLPGPPWSISSVGTPGRCSRPFLNPSLLSVKIFGALVSYFAPLPCVPRVFSLFWLLAFHSAGIPALPLPTLEDKGRHTGLPGPLCNALPMKDSKLDAEYVSITSSVINCKYLCLSLACIAYMVGSQ